MDVAAGCRNNVTTIQCSSGRAAKGVGLLDLRVRIPPRHGCLSVVSVVFCQVEVSGVHRVLVGKPEGKKPLGRPRRRWEDNIKMDLQEVGGSCGDWMELAQDRDRWRTFVDTVRNFRVP